MLECVLKVVKCCAREGNGFGTTVHPKTEKQTSKRYVPQIPEQKMCSYLS